MKRHLSVILLALLIALSFLLSGCITIVVPTDPAESAKTEDPETETTAVPDSDPTGRPTEKPTDKASDPATDIPETDVPSTDDPASETPEETAGPVPPVARNLESLPVLVFSHAKNDWSSDIQRYKYQVEWPQFSVLSKDWPAFQAAIEKWNTSEDMTGLIRYTDNLPDAQKAFSPAMAPWTDDTKAYVQRADEMIFSVLLEHVIYHGGAHPATVHRQLNMDPSTGKELSLEDVIRDRGRFTEKALSELEKQGMGQYAGFFDGYLETFKGLLQKELDGEDMAGLSWVLLPDCLRFVADEYVLAPYSFGPVRVDVPFYEDETLYLKAEYYTAADGEFTAVGKTGDRFTGTFTEGSKEYYVTVTDIPGEYYGEFEISVTEFMIRENRGLGISNVWLLEKNGKHYVYVEVFYENGYSQIYVYRVSANELTFIDKQALKLAGARIDPDHLLWQQNGDALGTWTGYAKARILDNGLFEADELFYLDNRDDSFYKNEKRTLTAKREVRLFSLEDPDKEILISAGTRLVPYETDFKSFVDVVLPDGTCARIRYEHDKTRYTYTIDGVDQDDVFDGIMYAG